MLKKGWLPDNINVFLITSALLLVIGLAFILYLDYKTKSNIVSEFEEEIHLELEQRAGEVETYIENTRNAVDFLYSTPPIEAIVRSTQNNGIDPVDGTPIEKWYNRIETIFEAYLENKQYIDQARIIHFNEHGTELVRVQQTKGNVTVVKRTRLQNKSDSHYFKQANTLKPGEVYVTPINLNREWGKIEFPYWPTYRVLRNIYDDHNQPFGFIIVNVHPDDLLSALPANLDNKYQLYLANAEGGAVIHSDPSQSFAFEFEKGHQWASSEIKKVAGGGFFSGFDHVIQNGKPFYFKQRKVVISPHKENDLNLIIGFSEDIFYSEVNARRTFTALMVAGLLTLFILVLAVLNRSYKKQVELSKKEAEYQAIFDGSNDAVISMGRDGNIRSWNKAAERMFGYTERAAIGNSIFELILHKDNSQFSINLLLQVFEGESVKPTDLSAKNSRGERLDISITLSPIVLGREGIVEGAACILRDVTEQKVVEKQILQLNTSLENQVKERTAELEQARNEALQVSKVKSEFIASVSHEIRTPMNGVIGMLHMLEKTPLNDLQTKYLSMAHNSAKALTTLINDILDLSKIEAGKLELDKQKFDVFNLFEDTSKSLAIQAQNKGLKFILDTSGVEYSYLTSDDNRIRQVLINLVNNATKFTSQGYVRVKVYTEVIDEKNAYLNFEVKDTGVGIAKEKQPKLFQSFSQEDSSTSRKYGGTGLGLAICKKLAELLEGNITLHSETGKGSTFKFTAKTQIASKKHAFHHLAKSLSKINIVVAVCDIAFKDLVQNTLRKFTHNYAISKGIDSINPPSTKQGNSGPSEILLITDASSAELERFEQLSEFKILQLAENLEHTPNKAHWSLHAPFSSRSLIKKLCEIENVTIEPLGLYEDQNHTHNKEMTAIIDQHVGVPVLLVDDNEINLEVAKGMLLEYGLEVECTTSGEVAISMLKNKSYQLVLMDCQMPIVDGFETTRRIRQGDAGETAAATPIIAMTANAMSGSKDDCLESGMNDYLTKPLNPEELEEKLVYWLQFQCELKTAQATVVQANEVQSTAPQDPSLNAANKQNDTALLSPNGLAAKLNDEPIWNMEDALKRVRYKNDRLCTLVEMFIEHTPSRVQRLLDFSKSNDWPEMVKLAHEVKGVSANIAAQRMYFLSSEIEQASKDQNLTLINILLPTLQPCLQELESAMREYLKEWLSKASQG